MISRRAPPPTLRETVDLMFANIKEADQGLVVVSLDYENKMAEPDRVDKTERKEQIEKVFGARCAFFAARSNCAHWRRQLAYWKARLAGNPQMTDKPIRGAAAWLPPTPEPDRRLPREPGEDDE